MGMFSGKIGPGDGRGQRPQHRLGDERGAVRRRGGTGLHPPAQPVQRAPRAAPGRAARPEAGRALRRAEGRGHRRGCSRRSGRPTGGWTSSFTPSPSPRRRSCASPYLQTSRAGWHLAMDISAYSLVAACRAAAPLMTGGGTMVTISYFGGEKVMPGYNLMGVCKAALEHSVRYLAWDLGRQEHPRQRHQRRPDADPQRGRHRRFRRDARARRPEGLPGPQRRVPGTGHHRPLSARAIFPAA